MLACIGNINDNQLLIKLKSLVIDLGYDCRDLAKSPQQMNSETIPDLKGNTLASVGLL